MPDLLAGTIIQAADTPPTVRDTEAGSYTTTSATYTTTSSGGTYVDCGVAFTACTTGRALLHYGGGLVNSGANFTIMAPVIREGATIGTGTVFLAGADANAVFNVGTNEIGVGRSLEVTGLTPGNVYNVRLEHGVSAGTGTLRLRWVVVAPAP